MPTVCCLRMSLLLWGQLDTISLITPGSLTSEAWLRIGPQCRVERQSMLSWLSMWETNAMPKSLKWWTVFRHKFVHMVCLRERDPNSIAYCIKKRNVSNSYIPRRVWDCDHRFCYCGFSKSTVDNEGCEICSNDVMKAIKQSVAGGKISPELKQFL